ncbi:glucan 1,3-beta-glucosidase-4 [Elsinoe australis]|uniref:glucan 1,3-beta-glucosidase n=1 Tax=Elsinoe australis TaxID=40998 RepID=A0A4U7AST5_9PEZI|nr:glucan 1,3-beta-glucosidase-4 [Elsinoe australis]
MHLNYITISLALMASSVTALPAGLKLRDLPLSTNGNAVGYKATDPNAALWPVPGAPNGKTGTAPYATGTGTPPYATGKPPQSTGTPKPPKSSDDKIRGVNLGGWLVLEKWMTPEVFTGAFSDAKDQWTFDQIQGSQEALEKHWSTYITEQDIAQIASWGINTLRIPIGYWAYNHSTNAPYVTGADKYLEQALQWSRSNSLKVLIDLHGVPGSQNGFDNSGQSGSALWQESDNMAGAINALEQIATKYGTQDYADVVWGIQMVNEPISWSDSINPEKTHEWAQTAFKQLSGNKQAPYKIIMHDAFETPKKWADLGKELNANSASDPLFWIDTHLYQNQVDADSQLNQQEHIEKACNWSTSALIPDVPQVPVIVGEFSAQTNVCVNPDGSSLAGKVCTVDQCQCSADDMSSWRQPLKDATTKFLEAELDTFEKSAAGWFMWSYKAPGAWGLANLMQYGILGKTVTDRKFPGQCQTY